MEQRNMIAQSEPTFWVRIYLSGPMDVICQTIRQYCLERGLCVTVEPTRFIYTGGEETGAVVQLINYPRFPETQEALWIAASELADRLRKATHQRSVLIMSPDTAEWRTLEDR